MHELHSFWFDQIELTESYYEKQIHRWFFGRDPDFDHECRERFAPLLDKNWDSTNPLGQILLLDQIPRNAFRGTPRAYAWDKGAQELSLKILGTTLESRLSLPERIFLYMPLEHAEDLELQDLSVKKFEELHQLAPKEIQAWTALGVEKAHSHRETIKKFGHFPSRSRLVGHIRS